MLDMKKILRFDRSNCARFYAQTGGEIAKDRPFWATKRGNSGILPGDAGRGFVRVQGLSPGTSWAGWPPRSRRNGAGRAEGLGERMWPSALPAPRTVAAEVGIC